ncbi:hypothetical protein P5673_033372 [Acropora cervicornis]|uniref:DNA/RNA non-specific endonuclease/pyrophosphatase/phosphodiesterase domain-containing protein n=1 Tax=Acropora cervicornis TaxID=6130 RepID=A0AAD9PQ06_ACRCE|nr:hypothetical protein P5673_033372 [Acropora cervicornis]
MARFIGLFFALALSKHFLFRVTGQHKCSSSLEISGCECLFLGACDVHGNLKDNLDLAKHVPLGLEQFGHVNNPLAERNLAYLCEGLTVGILYDCNNRIPLYAATVIRGSQFNGEPGKRPDTSFKRSKSGLQKYFQQSNKDYQKASKRKICYFKRSFGKEVVDVAWYRAKNSVMPSDDVCIGGSSDLKTQVHRGHLVASQYGVGDQTLKKATFVYTNAVPQFGDYNSVPWRIAEGALVDWFSKNCVSNGKQNAQMFIIVGVTPSTMLGPSRTPRYFGKEGFSDYQDDTNYRVNVPADMWTAACCTFMFTKDWGQSWQWGVKSTAFWRKNEPGKLPVKPESVLGLEWMLSLSTPSKINLFPYSAGECSKLANHVMI